MDSAYSGIVLGSLYLLSGRNLWTHILAHGLSDKAAVIIISWAGRVDFGGEAAPAATVK